MGGKKPAKAGPQTVGQLPAHQGQNHSWEAGQLPGGLSAPAQFAEVALARTPEGAGCPQELLWGRAWTPQMAQELADICATEYFAVITVSSLRQLPSCYI